MGRARPTACLAWLLLAAACVMTSGVSDRKLSRSNARNWAAEARKKAATAAKTFLEESGQSLMVPVDVDVFLIGFDGNGGYAHKTDPFDLLNLLNAGTNHHCPHSLESGAELGVCFQINYQVMAEDHLGDEAIHLLSKIEAHLKGHLKDPYADMPWMRVRGRIQPDGTPEPPPKDDYVVDAAGMEPLFEAFLESAYGFIDESETKGHNWHQHNPIIIINPSKVRANPKGTPEDQNHKVPDFLFQWHNHDYKPEELLKEEAGLTYTYSYNGAGSSSAWMSSRNYIVLDVSAGPSTYGPATSGKQGGVVGPGSFPALRDVYRGIFDDLLHVGPTLTAQEHAQVIAEHAQKALFNGGLTALIMDAARGLFLPDMVTEHIEYARSLLIPVVLLTDYELTDHEYDHLMQQENFMHINLTHVEQSVARLIDPQQEAVVVSAHHPLSRHKGIAAALWKARRTRSEPALEHAEGKARVGHHTISHTSVDPDLLIEELALSADGLTHGLVSAAHAMSKEGAHHVEQLRHDGTRVVPVFVISLMKAPDDIMFTNKDMVVASHDAVIVLQLRQSAQWGGVRDSYFTGHIANGMRVTSDAREVTRHVVAGLAQAIAGIPPPYSRPQPPGPARGPPQTDWRWAVGATPFGPYSNFSGVSELMQNTARRNALVAHVSAALRASQEKLDELDEFVAEHFQGPWAAVGVGGGKAEGRRHFLDTVVDTRHGFKTALTPESVAVLEGHMSNLTTGIETLAVDLYSHDFPSADASINADLLPAAARLCSGLDEALNEARQVMACCAARHVSTLGRVVIMFLGGAAAFTVVFVTAIAIAVRSGRRRRSLSDLGLPTYGMSQYSYSRPNSGLSFSSRPASRASQWQL